MFGDRSWLSQRTEKQERRFSDWVARLESCSAKLAVIELGAGSAVATVRHASERVIKAISGTLSPVPSNP